LAERKRVVTPWLWALIGLGVALFVVLVVGPWVLTRFPHEGITAEQELKAKNDVRTTLVQALAGLAVAGGLVLTYRTFRQNRIEQDRTYERELYSKAIEQLGHDHAPVRLGALYSLATLGQDRPDRRQMVVDVLCAYLRMPYAPPPESADALPDQERQVRLTAERLLSEHVRRPNGVSGEDAQHVAPSPDESYWPNISLDVTGAYLIDLDLSNASVVDARFDGATFTGTALFEEATFTGTALFEGATFTGTALFEGATFTGTAMFVEATFYGRAGFDWATFTGDAMFSGATFDCDALFDRATFTDALFTGATFTEGAEFNRATFTGDAMFSGATFNIPASFDGAQVLNLDDSQVLESDEVRLRLLVWPNGWTVRTNADDPTRGTLVHKPPGSSLEPPEEAGG
jgi:Pentapeptide repeats (9 copies)